MLPAAGAALVGVLTRALLLPSVWSLQASVSLEAGRQVVGGSTSRVFLPGRPGGAPPTPAPAPVRPTATPAPAPAPAPVERHAGDWSYAPLTPGDWAFRRDGAISTAMFGVAGGDATALFRCEAGTITIARAGVIPADIAAALNIRTSFAERALPIRVVPGAGRMLAASLPATDPLFDQIIYSRGRFVIEATRQPPMIVPTRPEVARVIENCRGA